MTLPAMPASDIASRIRATAQQLVAEGIWPTVINVRERLGTGSNTTINNELRAWRQWFLARVSSSTRRPDWPDVLGDAMDALWQAACGQAESQLEALRAEATAELVALHETSTRQAEALQEADAARLQAQEERETACAERDARAQACAHLERQLAERETELAAARRDAENLREQLRTLAHQHEAALAAHEHQAGLRVQAAVADGEKREALAYERLEGLRAMLYEQADRERLEHGQEKKRLDAQIADLRQELAGMQAGWHERLLASERERAAVEARAEALQSNLADCGQRLQAALDGERRQAAHIAALGQQLARFQAGTGDGAPA